MAVSREELAAWADGEIAGARSEEIAAEVAADPKLQHEVEAHRRLRAKLGAHFAPMLEREIPDRLAAQLRLENTVASIAAARERRETRLRLPRWSWIAGPALAATLALALFFPRTANDARPDYAGAQLAEALETQLVSDQGSEAATQIVLSFRSERGEFCRAFARSDAGGIACRDETGWRIEAESAGGLRAGNEFRQAGADRAALMEQAQEMAAGPALNAHEEAAARASGWR